MDIFLISRMFKDENKEDAKTNFHKMSTNFIAIY